MLKFDGGYKGAVELYVEKEARASRKHEWELRKMLVPYRKVSDVQSKRSYRRALLCTRQERKNPRKKGMRLPLLSDLGRMYVERYILLRSRRRRVTACAGQSSLAKPLGLRASAGASTSLFQSRVLFKVARGRYLLQDAVDALTD